MDLVPGRDLSSVSGLDPTQGQAKRISNERQMIAKLDPEVLQDRYLRLYDDHWVLKQHARKQEDKLTKLATTLKKVIADKKKSEALPLGVKAATRDVETENRLTDQQNQISKLQEENKLLRQRLVVSQQQAQQMRKSATMYDDVSSKIDTGQPKRLPATLMNNIRVIGPRDSSRSGATPRANSGLLEEARMTNRQLEESLEKANQQLSVNEQELERLRQQLRQRDSEFDQNLQRLKAQGLGGDSRTNLQENIDMIRLQRDLRDKSDELRRLQTQAATFESQNRSLQHTNAELLKEVDRLDREIKAEQQRSMQLRGELRSGSRSNTAVPELKAEIDDLRRECQLLKDANTKIVSSAFNADREREFREKERALQLKIAQLEATMKADMNERGSLLDRITTERNTKRDSEEEHRQMHLKYLETREKYDDLAEKMRFFEREGDINMKEIEEALIILRQRKQREEPNFDFLQKVDDEKAQNLNRRILDLESQLVEAQNELEKVRNLLITQHKINREYKAEMECMQRKMDEVKGESDQRLVETSYHLDIRRERILKLEKALKDVAYGTRSYRIQEPAVGEGDLVEQAIELERGQNLIEIHISRATFAERALEFFGKGNEPSTFCSIEFFEHELQMSPIIKGRTPEYNFTAQYIVNVDDFLLYYLQKEYTLIELHQTVGQAFQTVAACKLSLKQLVEGTHGRIHGTAKLIASHESNLDIGTFGTVEFWVRLRVPMEQAFRLLKEKMKAQGYLATTSRSARAAEETEKQRELDPNMNELTVAILNCSNVKSMVPGQQPDLFCVYKFYDFPDHDSITIPASNNPNFDDRAQYPVQMDADLDRYLKQQQMTIFVFDNQDPQTDRYVARADIPLISLAHDSPIKGTFDLYNDRGERNGTMDVTMKWNNSYLPPSSSTRTASQRARAGPTNIREPVALLPDESVSGYKTLAQKKKELDVHVRQKDVITSDTESRRTPDKLRKMPNGGEPTPSRVARPPTTTNGQPAHPRTSSNASVASKRVSFDHRDDSDSVVYPTENPPFAHDETIRTVSPDSNIGEEHPPPRPTPYVDDSEPDIVYEGAHKNNGDIVTIGVHELTLNERCSVFDDDDREKVFVSVEFLDFPLEQMETPYALPKGTPNTKYSFNFQQDYSVANPERKRQLAELLSSRSGEIRFTVVAEPAEDQQDALDCLDVGYATVDVKELLRKGSDISEKDIPVHGLDADGEVIGKMNVTVSIVSALNKAQQDQTRRLRT